MIGEVTFGVIGLLFLFADLRTFSSTFQLTFFGAPNTNLGVAAAAVFATSFLALLVGARLGPRRAVGLSAVFLVLALAVAANRATEPKQMGPEKRLFAFSILYLFLLFAVLVADKWMLA